MVSNSAGTAVSEKAVLTVVAREVWGWGKNDYQQATPPPGLGEVVATACGGELSHALRADGTVIAWGLGGYYGLTNVPAGLAGVTATALGNSHSLALVTNGSVVGWGDPDLGVFVGSQDWTNMVAISAGYYYCLGLRSNGTVSTTRGIGPSAYSPEISPDLRNVTAVAAGGNHCLTLRGDGTVLAWGNNAFGQTNVPAGLNDVVAVAAGGEHSLALRANGMVVAWGNNSSGQTNVPVSLNDVVAIAGGQNHSLALRSDGAVIAWGNNHHGQTNVPAYAFPAGAIGGGPAADHCLAVPAAGPPFITTRLANQTWSPLSPPAALFLRVQAAGAWPLWYQWRRNGVDLPGKTNAVLQISDPINQQGRYSVIVSNALGVATIPSARLQVVFPLAPLQVALENTLDWSGGGDSAWFAQTVQTVDGVDAAQSGVITHNQQSWLETTVDGPGFLVYWWKVSSEPNYDFLEFHLDGALQTGRISGDIPWQQRIVPITNGTHTLRWRYAKDAADSAGLDAGFLDQVAFLAALPGAAMLPNGSFQLSFTNVTGTPFTVVGSTNVVLPLSNWTVLGSPAEISPGQLFTDPQATNNVQRFYRVRSP